MPRCPVCGGRTREPGICSIKCKREQQKLKRLQYDRRAKYSAWDKTRPLFCIVCGKRLRAPGKYCHKHRYLYMRDYRRRKKDVRSTASTK